MYDFLNDEFLQDPRASYTLIRYHFLHQHYIYCSGKFNIRKQGCRGWSPNEHESAFAYDDLEWAFELPIERFMLEVVAVILACGRQSAQFDNHTNKKIEQILAGRQIDELLACLSGAELAEFRADLALLGMIESNFSDHCKTKSMTTGEGLIANDVDHDTWPDGERMPYKLIRWLFLDQLYHYARIPDNLNCHWGSGSEKYEQQSQFAYEKIAPTLQRPIEKLMIEMLALLMAAGRHSTTFDRFHRTRIAGLLDDFDMKEVIDVLDDDEARDFKNDLASLHIGSEGQE